MGFDIRKAISRFSSKCQTQEEQKGGKMVNPSPKDGLSDSNPTSVAPKRDKVSIPSRKSREKISNFTPPRKSREKISNFIPPRKSRRREGKTNTKSVRFDDCKCSRSVKVSPLGPAISSSTTKSLPTTLPTSTPVSKRHNLDTSPIPLASVEDPPKTKTKSVKFEDCKCSSKSLSDSKRRNLDTNSIPLTSIEDPVQPTASSIGLVANENPVKPQARLPLPVGVHSRNLSYGTIYNAAKTTKSKEETPHPKDVRQHAPVIVDKSDGNRIGELKRSGSMRLAFGLGGCNYGHGSIINGVKSLKKGHNCASIVEDVIMGKQGSSLLEGDVEEIKNAGNREYKKGLFENAISLYDKAIALNPKDASCHHNKAAALTLLGRIKEAVEECLQAANCNPSYLRAHYRLGNLYTRLGQVDDAKRHFKLSGHSRGSEAVQRMLTVEASLKKMRDAIKAEDWDRLLIECTRTMVAGADASEEVIAAKAEALLKLKRANEALELLEGSNEVTETSCAKLLLLKVELYFSLGRFEDAAQAAEEAIYLEFNKNSLMQLKKAWGAADAHRAGNEYFKSRKYSEAYAMYSQALEYVPSNCVLLCKRASSMFKLGQWDRSIEDCNFALESCPNYSEAIAQRAQAHAKLGRWEESQRDYLLIGKQTRVSPTTVSKSLHKAQHGLKGAKCSQQLTKV